MKDVQSLINKLKNNLSEKRFNHSLRVAEIAVRLAEHYNQNSEKAYIAALLHDCSRFLKPHQMLKYAKSLNYEIEETELNEPKLLHASLSAYFAKRDYKIEDEQILSAISSHTVGNPKMSSLDKIVYLADHIEQERSYNGVERVRELAYQNLDLAVIESMNCMLEFLRIENKPVSKKTISNKQNIENQKQ